MMISNELLVNCDCTKSLWSLGRFVPRHPNLASTTLEVRRYRDVVCTAGSLSSTHYYHRYLLIFCFLPFLRSLPCCASNSTLLSSLTGNLFIASSTTRAPSTNFPCTSLSLSRSNLNFLSSSSLVFFSLVNFHPSGNSTLGLNL